MSKKTWILVYTFLFSALMNLNKDIGTQEESFDVAWVIEVKLHKLKKAIH